MKWNMKEISDKVIKQSKASQVFEYVGDMISYEDLSATKL
jgi:hypothetical protein